MPPAISIRSLGKKYQLGATLKNKRAEEFWALKDVSFDVQPGEIVGVIGRNGAGKSTLLKILSQITAPTLGEIRIRGRVSSLLEVGTGFHPELTGRENIFLNGAILGMSRAEIRQNLDAIVDFSGVERFIDTPVKRYSSGMYVRLAFSVAAHLEPEILIIDEVLAVGDVEFQRKCLGRMKDVAGDGRTVVFVSHNLAAVKRLCPKSTLLSEGRLMFWGDTDEALRTYMEYSNRVSETKLADRKDREGDGSLRIVDVKYLNHEHLERSEVAVGEDLNIALQYEIADEAGVDNVTVAIAINNDQEQQLTLVANEFNGHLFHRVEGSGFFVCRLPRIPLAEGSYTLNVCCRVNGQISDWVLNTSRFTVVPGDFYGTGRLPDKEQAKFLLDCEWEDKHVAEIDPG